MSADGRLDLDDLGEVIEGADSLDEVLGTDDVRPTLGERLESWGVAGWMRRHRLAIAGSAAAVIAIGGVAWIRHDPRPPDDGDLRLSVVDSLNQPGLNNDPAGVFQAIYTLAPQRSDDTVTLLGISGPGIRATSVGPPIHDTPDVSRTSNAVLAMIGCEDPAALVAREDQYHLLVRRTDVYGRTVDGQIPMPVGSMTQWAPAVISTCVQQLASTNLTVEAVRAAPVPRRSAVQLEVTVRNSFERRLGLDVVGYPGMNPRPSGPSVDVEPGGTATLRVTETIADCLSPRMDGMILAQDGSGSGVGVSNRTLDIYAHILSESPDQSAAPVTVTWSAEQSRPVTAAFTAACAGVPAYSARVVSTAPAPQAVRDAAAAQSGDPTTTVLRAVVAVETTADSVAVRDQTVEDGTTYDGNPMIVVIDPRTGKQAGPTASSPARTVDGVGLATIDWALTCSGGYSPPTTTLLLTRGGRTWPVWLSLDEKGLAAGVREVCPEVTLEMLQTSGWASMQPAVSG